MNSSKNNKFLLLGSALITMLMWLISYQEALAHMVHVWSHSEAYKHCFFIPIVVGYLIYEKKAELKSDSIKPVWWLLIPLLVIQLAYTIFVELSINLLMHASAYASFVLLVWLFIGHSMVRTIAFPLLYLAFCIPFGAELVPILQDVTADLSVGLLRLVNIPVYREGLYIYVSNGTFHVAEACAGVRFLIGTFAIGVLLAYLNYQRLWKRLAFILFCAVIPVLANGVRAFGIMVIGYLSDMKYATGADHLVYGWVFFAFVTIVIFLVGMISNDRPAKPRKPTSSQTYDESSLVKFAFIAVVCLLIPVLVSQYFFAKQDESSRSEPLSAAIGKIDGAKAESHAWGAATDDNVWGGSINGVAVRAIYVNESTTDKELVSSRHRIFDNENWTQKKLETRRVDGIKVDVAEVVNIRGESKKLAAWYVTHSYWSSNKLRVKIAQLMNKFKGLPSEGFYVVIELQDQQDVQLVSQKLELLLKNGEAM